MIPSLFDVQVKHSLLCFIYYTKNGMKKKKNKKGKILFRFCNIHITVVFYQVVVDFDSLFNWGLFQC